MEARVEDPAEEIKRLRNCVSDLVSILALPALWIGGEVSQVVSTLLDALLRMLRLDFACVRLNSLLGEMPFEMMRGARSLNLTSPPREIGDVLSHLLGDDPKNWPPLVRERIGDGEISIVPVLIGIQGDVGVLIAGSKRADFPGHTERLVLSVAANQAAIGLQEARLLGEQRRLATELDRRVAQRTRELAESNEELQLQVGLLQHIPVATWIFKPDGVPAFVNQGWLEYTGQTLEFIQSKPEAWMDAIHPEDREEASTAFWDGVRSGQGFTMEARFRRAHDSTYRWHLNRAVTLKDAEGNILRFVGTSTDIGDLKQVHENLRRAEENTRLIVDTALNAVVTMTETIPEMLWSATPDGLIDYCNKRVLGYSGLSAEDIMGSGWRKLLHPDDVDQAARIWASCLATGEPYRVEVRTLHGADRTYRWCITSALPLLDHHGRILKWFGTVVDMHDWKQSQEELRKIQAELAHVTRVMTIGQFTASIAHEVNQPLSGILMNAGTCLRMLDNDPPNIDGARETARRTIRDGNRALDVMTRLRDLFRKKDAAEESVDLNDATREVIALSFSELQSNRIMVQQAFAENLPAVKGDRLQIQQVILNLLRNASDAMRDVHDRPRQLLITTEGDGSRNITLTVRDTGIGFAPHAVDRLFESFYTTKDDGMGIGLSISRSIIEAHRGRLWASANEGPGSSFAFSIPQDHSADLVEDL